MGLEAFGETTSQETEKNELAEKVDLDIPTFQEKPDKLDLIAQLRKNGDSFEKAKTKVKNMTDESDIDLSGLEESDEEDEIDLSSLEESDESGNNPLFDEAMDKFKDATAGNAERVREITGIGSEDKKDEDFDWMEFYE